MDDGRKTREEFEMTDHGRRTSGLTRRDALKLAGAAGATAGLGRWAPVGARGRQGTPAGAPGTRPTLRVGIAELVEGLDPHAAPETPRLLVMYSLFDMLTERDYRGGETPGTGSEIVPMLAINSTRTDDLSFEIQLRDGVTFHDGQTLTVEDVKFSLERVLLDDTGEFARAQSNLGNISAVEVTEDSKLVITTGTPDPLLEKRLASWAAMIVPEATLEQIGTAEFARNPIGTGPYKFEEFRPDDGLTYVSHDRYWGGLPVAERVDFRLQPELATRIAALVSGELDVIVNVPPDQVAALSDEPGVEVRGVPQAAMMNLHYNTNAPVLQDKRRRQALSMAINRDLLAQSLWQGRATVTAGYQFPEWGPLYDPNRQGPGFDPNRARQLLEESDYNGEPIPIRVPGSSYTLGEETAQAITEMWRTVGVNAEVALIQTSQFWEEPERSVVTVGVSSDEFGDPDLWWGRIKTNVMPAGWWSSEASRRFDELGTAARETLDTAARRTAYQEMLDIYEDDGPGTDVLIPWDHFAVRQGIDWLPYSFRYIDLRPDNLRLVSS